MDDCLIQVKQNHFYLDDKSLVSDVLALDPTPILFESDVQPLLLYLLYGTQKATLSVDSNCKIGDIKRRCCQVSLGRVVHPRFLANPTLLWIYHM